MIHLVFKIGKIIVLNYVKVFKNMQGHLWILDQVVGFAEVGVASEDSLVDAVVLDFNYGYSSNIFIRVDEIMK